MSDGRGIELEIAYFVLGAGGMERRLPALPELEDAPAEPHAPWRAAFAAPRAEAAARSTSFTLDVGVTVLLPAPYERRLDAVSAGEA